MSDYQDFKKKALENPAVRAEYDRLAAEYAIKQAVIDARQASGLTQQQLAARTGINQADISKLETAPPILPCAPSNGLPPEWA